jgi:hypothetical protein
MSRTFTYTPKELETKVNKYIQQCNSNKLLPTKYGLAKALGVTDDTVTSWKKLPQYSEAIKKIEQEQQEHLIQKVAEGSRPIGSMFLLKSLHGFIEKGNDKGISINLNIGSLLDKLEHIDTKEVKRLGSDEYTVEG